MSDAVIDGGVFTVTVGGVKFVLKRRCSKLMFRAKGFMKTVGVLAGAEAAERMEPQDVTDEHVDASISWTDALLREAMVDPIMAPVGEETIAGKQYSPEYLEPYADVLFTEFMKSGLELGPLADCCEDKKEPSPQQD